MRANLELPKEDEKKESEAGSKEVEPLLAHAANERWTPAGGERSRVPRALTRIDRVCLTVSLRTPHSRDGSRGELLAHVSAHGPVDFLFVWGHTPKKEGAVDAACLSQWFPLRVRS